MRLSPALLLALGLAAHAQEYEGLSYPEVAQDPRLAAAQAKVEEQDVLGEIDRIDRQLSAQAEEIAGMQRQLDGVESRRIQAEDTLAAAQARFGQESTAVGKRCAALYRLSRQGLARVLFGAESPHDLRRRLHYLLAILDSDRERLAGFHAKVTQRKEALAQIDRDRATVAALQAELRLKEATLRDERARKLTLLQQVRERKEVAIRVIAERDRVQAQLTPAALPQVASAGPSTNASFRAAHGKLPWPTTGTVRQGFGWVQDPSGQTSRSDGVLIEAAYGTPFRAVFAGEVKQAGFIRWYGQTVLVDHGAYISVYAHANGLRVAAGDHVEQGQVLGFVGNSGMVEGSGYQLYFEIRYNGSPQDPLAWLAPGGR
ncbi:MAG: peptidoglycan DD-metalloendopeptidase family protein [Pseudomonadota bacterium]